MSLFAYQLSTSGRNEMINIDSYVREAIKKSGSQDGLCCIYTPHTTSGITINENADPDVRSDMTAFLSRLIPNSRDFRHSEGNSDSHIKSTLVGASETVIIKDGAPLLGTWQSVFFCEFDGPRTRKVFIKIV